MSLLMNKFQRIQNGGMIVTSINSVKKTRQPHIENELDCGFTLRQTVKILSVFKYSIRHYETIRKKINGIWALCTKFQAKIDYL